jgi:hypothetical protein
VISDVAPDCPPELAAGVILQSPTDNPATSLERARRLRAEPDRLMQIARRVRQQHSFQARAQQLLAAWDQA